MIISEKQHQANLKNAQHSTGPTSPEGKAAICHNAVTYGLRTHAIILTREDPGDYARLWDRLESDWQPQTNTEWCYLETMITSQWLLTRIAESECRIYADTEFREEQFRLLSHIYKLRAQLERSFRTAIADMKQTQKERQAAPQPEPQTETMRQNATPATEKSVASQPPAPPPGYVTSEPAGIHPVVCAPAATDSR